MITSDYSTKPISPAEVLEVRDLKAIADVEISDIKLDDYPNLLVFPDSFCSYDRDFGKKCICSLSSDGNTLTTNSIVGFVGCNNTHLSIHSRFSKSGSNDFFLHYMLQKVSKVNILNLNHSFDEDGVFDFLMYLFPAYLKRAVGQGVYKRYMSFEHNDANVRGVIDINRHIKYNEPFNGKVAYRTRQYSFDNDVTQLVRHTIEYISKTQTGLNLLKIDEETHQAVKIISDATPSYSHGEVHSVISRNLRPLSHPYYSEYKNLQRLCLQILRHEKLKYGPEDNEIYGVLIDAAWLWEEYLATVLKDRFTHYNHESAFNLFEKNDKVKIIPDFLSQDKTIVLDAKYIPLGNKVNYNESEVRSLYYKTIVYMYRFGAKKGYLLYPSQDNAKVPPTTIKRIEDHKDSQIIEIGMQIPQESDNFSKFVEDMEYSEANYLKYIAELCEPEHILRQSSNQVGGK